VKNSAVVKVMRRIKSAFRMEEGQDLIEYALLIHIVALGIVACSMQMAKSIAGVYSAATSQLASAIAGSSAPGAPPAPSGPGGHSGDGGGDGGQDH
jgi:Flp pilus assembly pilin Flp